MKAQLELQKRAAIAQAVAQDFLAKNQATEEEILAQYESQVKLAPPLQFKARHILVDTQAAAVDLIAQLEDGSDFEELAKTHSTGPSGSSGGDLGWFSPEQMVKPFSDAVQALEDGAYTSEPVQTQFGWHVILREDSRTNEPPTLESVRQVIKQSIEQTKLQQYIEELRSSAAMPE
jgi:peptidyl-prolyl cis-trans isomerase C